MHIQQRSPISEADVQTEMRWGNMTWNMFRKMSHSLLLP